MTYIAGGPIAATDYNTFASSINEIYADLYPGVSTFPLSSFGYGQGTILPVVTGTSVTASQWAALFTAIKNAGIHQGTTTTPPLPAVMPVAGNTITAYSTPTTIAAVITLLRTNKLALAPGQTTLTTGANFIQPSAVIPWTSTLTFNCRVDFGSWDNARYFFNSGGEVLLNGANPTIATPEDIVWSNLLAGMSPMKFGATTSTSPDGTSATAVGFYDLTTAYQTIYNKAPGGGSGGAYYTGTYIRASAKLASAAGTNGQVDFTIVMFNGDSTPNPKSSTTTFRIDTIRASGASVSYPGSIVISSVGANSGFIRT